MEEARKKFLLSVPLGVVVAILLSLLVAFSRFADGHPTESLMEDDRTESPKLGDDFGNDEVDYSREEALENLQKIFGIRGKSASKSFRRKIPPQFMTELYNTVADSLGVTRGKNPYNARIVRSYVERETRLSQLYLFDVSGLEINESIIEAELHLFRKRSHYKVINPTILRSPYYLIRVYQVLEGQSLNEPDVHRLLNVHYVGAHASGWQVFNVKQAVHAWIAGAPNLGLLVTASTLFGDEATVEFTRRNEYNPSKQPILVLFNSDGRVDEGIDDAIPGVPRYYAYNDDEEQQDEPVEDTDDDGGYVEEEKEEEIGDDRSDVEEKEEDEEEIGDRRSGSTVDRRKRQLDQSAFEAIMETEAPHEYGKIGESNKEIDYGTQLGTNDNHLAIGESEIFRRFKRIDRSRDFSHLTSENYLAARKLSSRDGGNDGNTGSLFRRARSASPDYPERAASRNPFGRNDGLEFVTDGRRKKVPQVLSSMDIYERAVLRQRIRKKSGEFATEGKGDYYYTWPEKIPSERGKQRFPREVDGTGRTSDVDSPADDADDAGCARRDLYVDFDDVGLANSVIAPRGYSAYQCQGRCDGSRDRQTTNHASVREIFRGFGLLGDFHLPCCVPIQLLGISILFFDEHENVVLKVYDDMIADRCGCR